ncbi:MAG: family 20 glycosylhydrolase [Candidatus Lokiarchaeota archaeon]|nr:family 20 glycosylhydrolase [Candidatus Lokiarchaeota archaeon]
MKHVAIIGELAPVAKLADPASKVCLCPAPRKISYKAGAVEIGANASFATSEIEDTYLLAQINEELTIYKGKVLQKDATGTRIKAVMAKLGKDIAIAGDEGYHLDVLDDAIVIAANTPAGLFYGVQLLYQLLVEDGKRLIVPRVTVDDHPKMAIRGLSQDISRGQSPSVEAVKRHIKVMSRFRLNMYQFYIEDMFAFTKYPRIGKGRGALTAAAIKELDAYAKQYHVEIVPIFQNLSHMENMLEDPDIMELGEFPGAGSLDLSNPKIYDFLRDLFDEIAPAFSSPRFHIGCDESWDVGTFKSGEFIQKKGMGKALIDHYLWVIDELKKHGKKTFFLYHDIAFKYDEVLEGLPKENAVMVFWEYSIKDDWPDIDRIAKFKVPFVVSSSALCWMAPFPDYTRAFMANRKLIDNGLRKGAIGQINSAWGDMGQENFHENNLPAFCFSSAYSWNNDGFDDAKFVDAYCKAMHGITSGYFQELFSAVMSIHAEFPSRYLRRWLGFLWRHPYHSIALDNVHPTISDDDHMDIHEDLVYHENDMEAQKPLCDKIIALVGQLKAEARRNVKNLEYYAFAGMLLRYFIHKIQTTAKVTNMCKDGVDAGKARQVEALVQPVIAEIQELRGMFEDLWLNCASRPNLDRILRFYDWQIAWQQQKIEQVKAGVAWVNPYLESEWIAFEELDQHQEPRYFRKVFDVTQAEIKSLARAHLEVVPGNHATVWLNGAQVGEALCSYQSAVVVNDHNIEAWDIKAHLKPGKNVIAIKAINYLFGQPLLNVYAELASKDGKVRKLVTDKTWRAAKDARDGWNASPSFDDASWSTPACVGKPPKVMGEICLPRFDHGIEWKSKHGHHGFCRILRHKKTPKLEQPLDILSDISFYSGNVL